MEGARAGEAGEEAYSEEECISSNEEDREREDTRVEPESPPGFTLEVEGGGGGEVGSTCLWE